MQTSGMKHFGATGPSYRKRHILDMVVYKGFIEIPTRCILFVYLSALHVSGYAHLQELQMYFANHRFVY